jgi:glucose-6-phosphate-specific signal transduction histidine kinase
MDRATATHHQGGVVCRVPGDLRRLIRFDVLITERLARACRIFVQCVASSVIVTVEDDRIYGGRPARAIRRRGGLGLVGIRERASDLGGRFRIGGKSGKGTRLTIELPLAARG